MTDINTCMQLGPVSRHSLWKRVIGVVQMWRLRVHLRAALARMDDHMLRDIGVTRAWAREQIGKPFWRA